jgi:O-antigen/teichoic acid export membrane protein
VPIVFGILINANYNEAYNLIPIAIIAAVLQVYVGLFSTIYTAKKQTGSIAITSTIAAIINIVVDIALVNIIGIYAAVVSTVVSYAFLVIYRHIHVNQKFIKVKIDKKMLLNFILAICVCSSIYYIDNVYVKIINIILACFCAVYFNIGNMKFVINIVKEKTKKGEQ